MLFLTPYKLPFVYDCVEHGECDHTIQLQKFNGRWHFVTVRVICCQCFEEARTKKDHMYSYTDFDLDTYEWESILKELHLPDVTEN